jgi:hypothetical protein
VFGFKPVSTAVTGVPVVPAESVTTAVFEAYAAVVPYSKRYVVALPFGLIVPFSVAVVVRRFVGEDVVTTGFAAARVAKVTTADVVVPVALVATTRK